MQLTELIEKFVKPTTLSEYNKLMQYYEVSGWVWCNGIKPTEFKHNWVAGNCYSIKPRFGYWDPNDLGYNQVIKITLQEFKELQEIYTWTGNIPSIDVCPDCIKMHTHNSNKSSFTHSPIPNQITKTKQGETNMSNFNFVTNKDVKNMVIAIYAPGITKNDVEIRADEKNNTLVVVAKSSMKFPKLVDDQMDMDINEIFKCDVSYNAATAVTSVTNGMIIIKLSSAEHIKSLEVK